MNELEKLKEENKELKRQIEKIKLSYNIFFLGNNYTNDFYNKNNNRRLK